MRQTFFSTLAIGCRDQGDGISQRYGSTPDAVLASGGHSQGAGRGHGWDIPEREPQGLEGFWLNPPTSGRCGEKLAQMLRLEGSHRLTQQGAC